MSLPTSHGFAVTSSNLALFHVCPCDDFRRMALAFITPSSVSNIASSEYLQSPIVQQEQNVDAFVSRAPYFVFLHARKESFIQQIKAILGRALGGAFPTTAEMASQLNMSEQTFFRRLKAEGVSYVQLKNAMRAELAIHYLNNSELSNDAISELLGFENPSTFYRSCCV